MLKLSYIIAPFVAFLCEQISRDLIYHESYICWLLSGWSQIRPRPIHFYPAGATSGLYTRVVPGTPPRVHDDRAMLLIFDQLVRRGNLLNTSNLRTAFHMRSRCVTHRVVCCVMLLVGVCLFVVQVHKLPAAMIQITKHSYFWHSLSQFRDPPSPSYETAHTYFSAYRSVPLGRYYWHSLQCLFNAKACVWSGAILCNFEHEYMCECCNVSPSIRPSDNMYIGNTATSTTHTPKPRTYSASSAMLICTATDCMWSVVDVC